MAGRTAIELLHGQITINSTLLSSKLNRRFDDFNGVGVTTIVSIDIPGTALKGNARKAVKEEIKHWIRLELWAWLLQQPDDNFASLALNDDSTCDLVFIIIYCYEPEVLIHIEIHRLKFCIHTFWVMINMSGMIQWDNQKQNLFAARLSASSIDSLSISPPRLPYIVKYNNSLIGKHFKMLQQLRATEELRALLWFPEIKNMDVYLADIKVLVDNGLDLWGLIDPQRVIVKGKLHTFLKIFSGLAQPFSMQPRYLNVGRTWSASSIWSAVDGGKGKVKSIPRQAGVSDLSWHPTGSFNVAWDGLKSLGWKVVNKLNHSVKLQVFKKRTPAVWDPTSELVEPAPLGSSWNRCKSVIARSGDLCVQLSEMGPAKHTETMAETQATRVQNRTNKEAMTSAQEKRQHEGNDPESKSNPEEGDRGK
ncbi:hypothetical protein B0H10DRAFT_1967671 [Mycena sp. CBHHK59/15]|nr:hypothetical protein B0H10DRAFT_1967671 [Mycena sp. CBHHK59/15]